MIYFLADDHFGARPGATLHAELHRDHNIHFEENLFPCLESSDFIDKCSLLILNFIAGTGTTPLLTSVAEQNVRRYLERSKPLLLLHAGSAAFWHWPWWRSIVGLRWVRANDPFGVPPSVHPVRPYWVDVCECDHPLIPHLRPMDLPGDEIYIHLEQTCPAVFLMQTAISEGTFPQCHENSSPWGGRVIGLLPGHSAEVVRHPDYLANVRAILNYLV